MMTSTDVLKLLICAVPALSGTACHDPGDAPDDTSVIQFHSVAIGRDATTTGSITAFKVTALAGGETIMKDVTVTRTGVNSWSYSPLVKWPEDNAVDFYAVSPPSVKVNINPSWYNTINYRSPGNEDLLVAVNMDTRPTSPTLRLNFRHALARVTMRAKTNRTDIRVKLRSVAVRNVADYGDFFYPRKSTLPGEEAGSLSSCWSTYYNGGYYTIFQGDSAITLSSEPVAVNSTGTEFFIPCTLADLEYSGYFTGAAIEISYQLIDKESGDIIWPDQTTEQILRDPTDHSFGMARLPLNEKLPGKRWESGKSYSYTLNLDSESYLPVSRTTLSTISANLTIK